VSSATYGPRTRLVTVRLNLVATQRGLDRFCAHPCVHGEELWRDLSQKSLRKSIVEGLLRSSRTLTPARLPSPRSCYCSAAPSRWPAPSRAVRPRALRPRT